MKPIIRKINRPLNKIILTEIEEILFETISGMIFERKESAIIHEVNCYNNMGKYEQLYQILPYDIDYYKKKYEDYEMLNEEWKQSNQWINFVEMQTGLKLFLEKHNIKV